MKRRYQHGIRLSLLASLIAPCWALAQDQDNDEPESPAVLGQIMVTARKKEETLQDVPFSIAAQTEEVLRNTGAFDVESLANNVAGFTVQNLGPGQSQVAMRGVSAGQVVRDQPGVKEQVGVYLDESVISLSLFTPDLDLFDVNRVEVLRGPQGTLFGSGSLSGTLRYITNQPDLEAYSSYAEVTGSSVSEGSSGGEGKGVLNVPIGDSSALRAAVYFKSYAGFIDAVQPDGSVDNDVNDGERYGARVSMRFEPSENLTITPRLVYQDVDLNGFNRTDAYNILANPFTTTRPRVDLNGREQYTQLDESFTDEFLLVDLNVEYAMNDMVMTSITSYTDRDVLVVRDATQLTASITGGSIGLGEEIYTLDAPLDDATTVEAFTQELRLSSDTESPFQWLVGGFYSQIDREYSQSLDVAGFEALSGIPTAGPLAATDILFFSNIPYDFEQFAVFGEASYLFTDRFTLTGGLRYFDFEENRVLNFDGIFADQTIGQRGRTSSDGISPRIMASYALSDDTILNAQVSKGFRLGGINDPLNEPLCSPEDLVTFGGRDSFNDEELINYEIGAKTTILDGRGTFNIAAFHMDIDDLQATLTAGTCSSRVIFNVPKSSSTGVEMELAMSPTANLDFSVTASYVNAELDSTVTSTAADGSISIVGGIEKGNRLPTTPKFQMAMNGTYFWGMDNGWDGYFSTTFQHVGSRYTQIGDQADGFGTVDLSVFPLGDPDQSLFTFDPELPSYNIGNMRLGVKNDQWDVSLFVNNISDTEARLALDQERGSLARVGFITNAPRTFGITARINF